MMIWCKIDLYIYTYIYRNPIPNLMSGSLLRLMFLQLQFVKKEMLLAINAIDELFNANQVNTKYTIYYN